MFKLPSVAHYIYCFLDTLSAEIKGVPTVMAFPAIYANITCHRETSRIATITKDAASSVIQGLQRNQCEALTYGILEHDFAGTGSWPGNNSSEGPFPREIPAVYCTLWQAYCLEAYPVGIL